MSTAEDLFVLYDLKIETVATDKAFVCSHTVGASFIAEGENLIFSIGVPFSLYVLAALLPLIPAKQRETEPNDWMTTDEMVACPDPNCGARFRITRIGKRTFRHSETTATKI